MGELWNTLKNEQKLKLFATFCIMVTVGYLLYYLALYIIVTFIKQNKYKCKFRSNYWKVFASQTLIRFLLYFIVFFMLDKFYSDALAFFIGACCCFFEYFIAFLLIKLFKIEKKCVKTISYIISFVFPVVILSRIINLHDNLQYEKESKIERDKLIQRRIDNIDDPAKKTKSITNQGIRETRYHQQLPEKIIESVSVV